MWEAEKVIVMSSVGNEAVREEYRKAHPKEAASWVDAINYMSGMRFSAIYDSKDPTKVIGIHSFFVSQSDFGGSVPKWLVNKMAAKGVHEFFDACITGASNVK